MFKFFDRQTNRNKPKNLKEILKKQNELEDKLKKISDELEKLKKESKFFVQKVGLVRYNPFSEVGGNQSFSIALLDGNNDGLIITSLYARDGNRVYSKPIKNGKSDYQLSDEEKKTIVEAKGSK
jgi:hypothetical protein